MDETRVTASFDGTEEERASIHRTLFMANTLQAVINTQSQMSFSEIMAALLEVMSLRMYKEGRPYVEMGATAKPEGSIVMAVWRVTNDEQAMLEAIQAAGLTTAYLMQLAREDAAKKAPEGEGGTDSVPCQDEG